MIKFRMIYGIIFVSLMIIEVLIAMYSHNTFIRHYVGDVLVVAVIYCFVRIFFPNKIKFLLLYIFIFSVMVELMQLFGIAQYISGENKLLRIVFGTAYDFKDIICYAVGGVITGVVEKAVSSFVKREN